MDGYIAREKVLEQAVYFDIETNAKVVFVDDIKTIPSADVIPVVPGRWVHDNNNLYACSECMERETMSPKKLKNYCPNCGAKMGVIV